MDPATMAALFNAGSKVLSTAVATPPPPPQRADGYAMGGTTDSSFNRNTSSGATGGAYGGAYTQAFMDGSNWTVSTGGSTAKGGGTSGAKPAFTPVQTTSQGGVAPQMPFTFSEPLLPSLTGSNNLVLAGAVLLAYLFFRR